MRTFFIDNVGSAGGDIIHREGHYSLVNYIRGTLFTWGQTGGNGNTYTRDTNRLFLHTNLHRAKCAMRVLNRIAWIKAHLKKNSQAILWLLFSVCMSIYCTDIAAFLRLGRSSGIATTRHAY